ncbi:hypothetical protein I600_3844 [Maribacter dokdonensis DSW-8]|nr:hypothetical protein I600_3844 [Maribacter dokdonensis DSW-8]
MAITLSCPDNNDKFPLFNPGTFGSAPISSEVNLEEGASTIVKPVLKIPP